MLVKALLLQSGAQPLTGAAAGLQSFTVLGHEGVQQRGVLLREVFLLDSVLQTQQLTWDQ